MTADHGDAAGPGAGGPARYTVEGVIGRGAMGVVYRARQVSTGGRIVAVKRVPSGDAELLARLRREAQILAELDHPNIVRVYDVVDDGSGLSVVMQHAAGGTLAQVLADHGRLPPDLVAEVVATLADALACAHRHGVLHRDIKPANILFSGDGDPLLSDFGGAHRDGTAPVTEPGGIGPATCEYLDPAVAAGAPFDQRSDCYALGVVAYEMLTGQRPFGGETPLAVLRAADEGSATPLSRLAPEVPAEFAAVVHAAIARHPTQRPASAGELAGRLRAAGTPRPAKGHAVVADDAGSGRSAGLPPAGSSPGLTTPRRARTDPPTRVFGPPPPPREAAAATPAPRWRRIVAVAAALLLLPPAVAAVALRRPPVAPAATPSTPVAMTARPLPLCPGVAAPSGSGGVLMGDLEGGGCRSWVRYDDGALEVARAGTVDRFRLGGAHDQLLLGDWDCDGSHTAGLYRPATGEVFRFNGWPAADTPLTSEPGEHSGIRDGTARVRRDDGCDHIKVTPSDRTAA